MIFSTAVSTLSSMSFSKKSIISVTGAAICTAAVVAQCYGI
jgi:hypothetical protein